MKLPTNDGEGRPGDDRGDCCGKSFRKCGGKEPFGCRYPNSDGLRCKLGMGGSSLLGDMEIGLCDGEGVECVETVSEKAPSDGRVEGGLVVESFALVSAAASSMVPVW